MISQQFLIPGSLRSVVQRRVEPMRTFRRHHLSRWKNPDFRAQKIRRLQSNRRGGRDCAKDRRQGLVGDWQQVPRGHRIFKVGFNDFWRWPLIGRLFSIIKYSNHSFWPLGIIFIKIVQPRPLFRLFLVFPNKHHYNFYNKYVWKMSIQYTVPGFEPMTFGKWVYSHNH